MRNYLFYIDIEQIITFRGLKVTIQVQNNSIETDAVQMRNRSLNKPNSRGAARFSAAQPDKFESSKKKNRRTNSAKNLLISIGVVLAIAAGALAVKGKFVKPVKID